MAATFIKQARRLVGRAEYQLTMCAICGIIDMSGSPVDPVQIDRMTSSLQHRGPDGNGRFVDGEIGLGHCRLSIIDVDGGAQPISNENATMQVVFNGEIYNFIELRKELEAAGHTFKTRSDTEVIVHAYEQWGADCVRRFNGMFAFAVWDSIARELFVARDHLGIKPLYHVQVGNRIIFASEIKALLQEPVCPREMDLGSLGELFTFRSVPSPKTLFKGISKLRPGHWMRIADGKIEIQRYWNWIPTARKNWRESDLIAEYQTLLEDAVRLQLRSDVPLGLFLSSGIDSGVLLAIMSRYSSGPVQTFTIGFKDGEATNEVDDAATIARQFGAEHHALMVGPQDYEQYFGQYMEDLEEPVAHEAAPAFHFVSRIAREHVKVALTGQGADEPWAGYDRYIGIKLSGIYSRLPEFIKSDVARFIGKVPGRMERIKRGVNALGEVDTLTRFAKVYSFFSAEMKSSLFQGALKTAFDEDNYGTRHALAELQEGVQHLDPLTQMLYIDTRSNLPDDLLMVGDKTSMANSLEVRVPFLDYRLVEFIESLPAHLKLKRFTGKYLHKKACEKWLPRDFIHRKKKGFANPIEDWFRQGMRSFVQDCLLSKDSSMAQYFDQKYIRKILDLDRCGKEQYRRQIYLLVSLELWHRTFLRN